jgi:hypothetical protein
MSGALSGECAISFGRLPKPLSQILFLFARHVQVDCRCLQACVAKPFLDCGERDFRGKTSHSESMAESFWTGHPTGDARESHVPYDKPVACRARKRPNSAPRLGMGRHLYEQLSQCRRNWHLPKVPGTTPFQSFKDYHVAASVHSLRCEI